MLMWSNPTHLKTLAAKVRWQHRLLVPNHGTISHICEKTSEIPWSGYVGIHGFIHRIHDPEWIGLIILEGEILLGPIVGFHGISSWNTAHTMCFFFMGLFSGIYHDIPSNWRRISQLSAVNNHWFLVGWGFLGLFPSVRYQNFKGHLRLSLTISWRFRSFHGIHNFQWMCSLLQTSPGIVLYKTGSWIDIYWLVVSNISIIIWDNPSHWLSYFSRWLKPPTSIVCVFTIRFEKIIPKFTMVRLDFKHQASTFDQGIFRASGRMAGDSIWTFRPKHYRPVRTGRMMDVRLHSI